ncbi:MAG: hypothetical protein IPJ19_05340 [Planctomycetes bacterium]|nr:hypothetical protein [Planctomycetota bacterium]
MSFFKNMNLARGIILFSVVGSIALGVLGYLQYDRLSKLQADLETSGAHKGANGSYDDSDVAKLVREIETLGRKHSQLTKVKTAEGFTETEGLGSYIERAITADGVELGEHDTSPNTVSVTKGIVDKKVLIKPTARDKVFQRSKIANFLYKLEADSRRIRVTDFTIELGGKNRVRDHEIPEENNWTYSVEITSRQRDEGK